MPSDSSGKRKVWLGHEQEMLRGYDAADVNPWSRMDARAVLANGSLSLKQRLEVLGWPGVIVDEELHELAAWFEPTPEIRKRGRPPVRRALAVEVLDLMRSKQIGRAAATRELCDCGKKKHDRTCVDRLREPIRELKELLTLNGIPF